MVPPPVVTGISPKEGPPGTKVTIRGEFLGNKPSDLVGLTICGSDCVLSAEWKSTNKIVARSGPGKGRGDIIVTTSSGGQGTCTVQFRGYYETIGPLKESAVWIEEAPLQNLGWSSRALSSSAFHIEDPLGLSVEGNEKKIPEDDLQELFPGCNGDLSSVNFSPGWFLLENHQATSFDDLRVGLSYLRRKVESQKEGQLSFLKGNVGSVMEQLETLENLRVMFTKDSQLHGLNRTEKLEVSIKKCISESEMMFEGVLKGREKADKTRNALGVLTRYKYLLTLPSTIDRNMAKGEYDPIISDYARVKNLFGKTEVNLFKKVLCEVESKIVDLKKILNERLRAMPNSIENQKKIIRCLIQLEYKGDPGWEVIQEYNKYIKNKLTECLKSYQNEISEDSGTKSSKTSSKNLKSSDKTSENGVSKQSKCVDVLINIIITRLPDMWNLGQSYFNSELFSKPDLSKRDQFRALVSDCVDSMSRLVHKVLFDASLATKTSPPSLTCFTSCLSSIRQCHMSCRLLPSLPESCFTSLLALTTDIRLVCIKTILKSTCDQVKSLTSKEEWDLEHDSKYGSLTKLPNIFESIISDCASTLKDAGTSKKNFEPDIFMDEKSKKEILVLTQNCFSAYVECLKELSANTDDDSVIVSQLTSSPTKANSHNLSLEWSERLVACICNCRYSSEVCVEQSITRLTPWLPALPPDQTKSALDQLEQHLTLSYLDAKCDPLVGTIEPSMYLGYFDWDTNLRPTDLRPYAKEIVVNIIAVLAELEQGCSWLKSKVIPKIVENVAEEVSRLILCVPNMSQEGAVQAALDIAAIQKALDPYLNHEAISFFNEALDSLPPLTPNDRKLISEIMKDFESKMCMQLSCFTSPPVKAERRK